MNRTRLERLVAATCTPLQSDGGLNREPIPAMVEWLLSQGIAGLYVCGSTGEGMSLSVKERRAVAEAFVDATNHRVPVIIQVGHNSLKEARGLARHAEEIGADIVSATCPSYFKVSDVPTLIHCMAEIAAGAPSLPFYYYHIPMLTGSTLNVARFLETGREQIPNLAGLKYTDSKLHEFQQCLELDNGSFDVVWGQDEMLVGALATGARAAIGSTYNIAAPLYQRIIDSFERGDLVAARRLQSLSINMIRVLNHYPFHAATKAVLGFLGHDVGGCRLPLGQLTGEQKNSLKKELDAIGFFDWSSHPEMKLTTKCNSGESGNSGESP